MAHPGRHRHRPDILHRRFADVHHNHRHTLGVQLFKLGTYALWPFGRELVNGPNEPGCLSTLMNLIWILLGWWEIALIHLVCGLIFCITIVGIPWGLQHFKMALSSVFPFGKEIR